MIENQAAIGAIRFGLGAAPGEIDEALAVLIAGLGDVWQQTVVVMATEFGRAARPNGNRGSDHGVAGAALVFGGAVRGGRVIADWPGLREGDLYEQRDLHPTADLRQLFAALLHEHLGYSTREIADTVLPGIVPATPFRDIVRA